MVEKPLNMTMIMAKWQPLSQYKYVYFQSMLYFFVLLLFWPVSGENTKFYNG